MLECRYKLNIDGYVREFNSDRELTEFIKNRLEKRKSNKDIKEGVSDLFDSNPELANDIYEALGFNKNLVNAKVISKTTAKEILNSFEGGMRENFKNVINKLLEIPAFAERTINYVERPVGNTIGFYDSLNDFLGLDILSEKETNATQARVIVEEVIHSLTSRLFKIAKGLMPGSLSESEKKFVNDISNLRKEVLRQRPQNANDYYGLSSDEEFVARAFADEPFQDYLARIEVQRTNVFSKIIEYVKQLLGSYVTVKDNSALQEVLGLTEEFISKKKITPQQKQQAQQLYSQYLDTIFPDSKVKDIVYHGSNQKIEKFNKPTAELSLGKPAIYFRKDYNKHIKDSKVSTSVIVNSEFPFIADGFLDYQERRSKRVFFDSVYIKNEDEFAVFEPEQIHILGSKQDIEGFKNFVSNSIKLSSENLDSYQTQALNIFFSDVYNKSLSSFDILRINEQLKQISDLIGDITWHLNRSQSGKWYVAGYKNAPVTSENYYSPFANGRYSSSNYSVKYSLTDEQAKVQENLSKIPSIEKGEDAELDGKMVDSKSDYYFLHTQHEIDGVMQYLSPSMDDKNYINNLIQDIKTNPANSPEELRNMSDSELETYLKSELEKNNKMLSISQRISGLVTMITNSKTYYEIKPAIDEYFDLANKYNKKDIEYTESSKRELFDKIKALSDKISESGVITPGLKITDPEKNVNSKIHLLRNDGTLDLFQIAVTRNPYSLWDSSKKLDQDYYLALRRHILNYYNDMSKSSLFIIPIVISEINGQLDPLSLTINDFVDRTNEPRMDFDKGIIQNKLNQILGKITREDEIINSEINEQNVKLLDTLFQNYNFKSQIMITDVDNLYNKGLENGRGSNEVYIVNRIKGGLIREEKTDGWEGRFRKKVEDYVKLYNENPTSRIYKLSTAVKNTKRNGEDWIKLSEKFDSTKINLVFGKYLDPNWSMLNNADLLQMGLIVFRNYKRGVVEVISVTANDLDLIYNMGMGKTILGKFATDKMTEKDPLIMKSNGTNIETMKTLAVLNNMPKLFGGGLKLGSIVVYNQVNNTTNYVNLDLALYNFNLLMDKAREKFENNFKKRIIVQADIVSVVYSEIMDKATESVRKEMKGLGDPNSLCSNQEKLKWFQQLQKIMESKYSKLSSANLTESQNMDDPLWYTYYLLSSVIAHYNNLSQEFDYGTPRLGIRFGDISHLIYTSFIGESPDFDKDGNPIVGILQGSWFNTTDTMGSKGVGKLHDLISITQNSIVKEYGSEANLINNKTLKYYSESGRSSLEKNLIGDADYLHKKFIKIDNYGKVAKEMMFVNPYSSKCALKTNEKEYLKFILFEIYKYNNKSSNLSFQNITLEEAEKKEDFMRMVLNDDSEYFQIPLVQRMGLAEMKVFTTEKLHKVIGQKFSNVKTELDPRNLFNEQRAELQRKVNKGVIHDIYNQFDMNPEFRQELINKYGVGAFEINLNTITLKYVMARIKERKYNALMPNIKAALAVFQFHAYKTGETEELRKAMEDFYKQLQVAVYDETPLKGEESENIVAWVKKFQRLASIMAISLRPALLIKELVVGTIKNVSYAWSKIYGDDSFTGKELTEAYHIMFNAGVSGELRNEFNLTDELNRFYRIANMDLNTVVDKTKIDRRGMMFFSDKLFWMNTAGDYANRLSLFIAKMIHDGTYNAHSLDSSGKMIYDPTKDKRFEYYLSKRESHKKDGKYIWSVKGSSDYDEKYNDQRASYLTIMEELNRERLVTGEKQFVESDMIDQAYTNRDRDSIKEFTDTAYGYYDHERSPLIRNTAFGMIFMQFLAFWPAKIKYYLGKPGYNTKRGYFAQKVDTDGNKVFLKYETNEEGEEICYETIEDTGIPSKAWIGTKAEGLMYSLVACIRDIKHGFKNTTKDQKARAKVAVHDILLGMLLMMIASLIFKNYKAKTKEDGEMLSWAQEYSTKILMKSMQEFDPVQSVFNSVKWTPAFVSIMSNSVSSFTGIFSGDTTLDKFFRTSFRALEILPQERK